ncbi:ComEC/Rec2 family competence protein [Treponema sp. OMZ 840]|uniref:ComEC/Rec2 family competence protein n=1 Tax=Treponema sp. OMZ 840 TaxID=244313 RepID=UPI003D8ADE90
MVEFKSGVKTAIVKIHPLKTAALILALLLYTGIVKPVNPFVFRSLFDVHSLTAVEGFVASNPVKTSSGRFYSMLFNTETVQSASGRAEAQGRIKLLIPAETVEALYPGKLFSLSRNAVPVEEGARLVCTGYVLKSSAPVFGSENEAVDEATAASGFRHLQQEKTPAFVAQTTAFAGWKNGLSRLRALCRLYLKRMLYAWGEAGGLVLALMSGSREYTDTNLAAAFKNAGLAHILALSGMHLSLFISASSLISLFAGKKLSALLSVILICVFIWFAGATPSLVRAFLCITLMMLTRLLYVHTYKSAALDCLCGAFIIQTSILHADIYNPAFMLSYAAVAGILILTPLISPFLHRILPRFAVSSAAASLSAWIFTAPIGAFMFGQISPIGIIASVVVTPLASVFFIAGFIFAVLCVLIPFLISPLGAIMQVLYIILKYAVLFFGRFPPIVF